ncbi:pilus assembly protein TadG-related protein [Pararhodobacter sp. CCB-MM2]|uniref:pilus assembly protein TadG-related protein n=1 Tax=Pararhodobacter sp. CCB-MM2 TaxID=1786003 RepID=UPI000836FF24|nr:pilus assembly protein TadG-related protein [Pararhodobacter sp. CCB-MM2]
MPQTTLPDSPAKRFIRADRGAVAVLFITVLPLLLLAGGIAIDLAHINAERRYVQAQADLAAMAAVHNLQSPEAMRSAARATVAANATYQSFPIPDVDIVLGTSSARGAFTPLADQMDTKAANAVSVAVTAPVTMFVLGLFVSREGLVVRREAIAAVERPRVSFALSNCLLELTLLNGLLRPLIGAEVDVLCSDRGVDTQVDLFEALTDLSIAANILSPSGEKATYGDVLNASLPASDLLTAFTGLTVAPSPGRVRLADALRLPEDIQRLTVDTPVHSVTLQKADLVLMTAELMAMTVFDLNTRVNLGPIADLGVHIRVGAPRQIVLNAIPGSPDAQAHSSQISLEFDEINILGLFKLRLNARLANASAALSDEGDACATDALDEIAVFDPVEASLLDVDLMTQAYGLPLASSALGFHAHSADRRTTQRIAFTRQRYDEDPVAHIGPTGPAAEAAVASLLRDEMVTMVEETAQALEDAASLQSCTSILSCAHNALTTLTATLTGTASNLLISSTNIANGLAADGNLTNDILEGLIGLQLARADLELIDVICPANHPRLIR